MTRFVIIAMLVLTLAGCSIPTKQWQHATREYVWTAMIAAAKTPDYSSNDSRKRWIVIENDVDVNSDLGRIVVRRKLSRSLLLPRQNEQIDTREWIFVTDHCDALIKIFKSGKVGETYNVGSNINVNNIDICKSLLKIAQKNINIGKKVKIKFVKDRPGHDRRYAIDSSKIIKRLKWKPKVKLIDGLNKTFNWYLNNKKYYRSLNIKDVTKRIGKI